MSDNFLKSIKIVVLTNGSRHGMCILDQLKADNIPLQAVILEKKSLGKKELKVLKDKLGPFSFLVNLLPFKNGLYRLFRKLNYKDASTADLKSFAHRVYKTTSFNSKKCESMLNDLQPDLIILGGAGIIKSHILTVPAKGTLNAHPGILPNYRGVDVIKWALFNEDPVGVTVHFVDEGIDSGDICLQEELDTKGLSVADIQERARVLAGKLLSKTVRMMIENTLNTKENNTSRGNYFKKMPGEQVKQLSEKRKL